MQEAAALIHQTCIREGPPCCPLQIVVRPCRKTVNPSVPACVTVEQWDTRHSLKIRHWEQTVLLPLTPASIFHLLPLQICCLGTASVRLQMVTLVTGGKRCSLSYWYPKASRPAVTDCFILKNKHCLAPWARSLSPALTSNLFTL